MRAQQKVEEEQSARTHRLQDALASIDNVMDDALDAFLLDAGAKCATSEAFRQASAEDMLTMLAECAKHAFDAAARGTAESVRALSEGETVETRKQLRAQATMFQMKLETARTAGAVSLQNQAASLEAAAARALESQLAKFAEGGDVALKEALAQVKERTEKLQAATVKIETLEEGLKNTKVLLMTSESERKKARRRWRSSRRRARGASRHCTRR